MANGQSQIRTGKKKYASPSRNQKIEDKIVDKWSKDESEAFIPAGENIFGQPTESMSMEEVLEMTMPVGAGYLSPFSTLKAAKSYFNLVGGIKGWRGYKLPSWFSKDQAKEIIEKVSRATGVPKGKLLKFAEQKMSGAKPAIKKNRQVVLKKMKEKGISEYRGSRPPHGRIFGGWKGGIKYDIKNTVNDKDMSKFLNEVLKGTSER